MKHLHIALACLLTVSALCSCNKFKGGVEIPAYLHLDRIDIVPQAQNAPSVEPGFYTSIVDAVQLVCWFEGDESETNLGVYQMPFTIPVLRHGTAKYIRVVPVVKQNGIAGSRIAYPYYQVIQLDNVALAPDSVTRLGRFDSVANQWYLQANYYSRDLIDILSEDYFEPTSFSINFDSMPDSATVANFSITTPYSPANTKILYLEMDYKTDLDLYINMLGFTLSTSGTATSNSVMTLYPNSQWQKIYINLGRTWRQFNYNTPITLFFQVANPDHKGGRVMLDNVKVITI